MKNKLKNIKNTWTYNHKMLIIALSLALVTVIQSGKLDKYVPTMPTYAATIEHVNPPQLTLADIVEERAHEIYQERAAIYLEQSRQEAIQEYGHKLLTLTGTSTFVDYDALKAQYGY